MTRVTRFSGSNVDLPKAIFLICVIITVITIIFIIGVTFYEAYPTFRREGINFIIGSKWSSDLHLYGIFPLIVSTVIMTGFTMILAIPIGVLTAIFLAEFAPAWLKSIIRPMIELLVGIPSVVYGILGYMVIGPIVQEYIKPSISSTLGFIPIFHDNIPFFREGALLASIVLTIMILPTIITLSEEAIRSVPKEYRDASYALGSTKFESIRKILLPVALPGILTAIVLGMMRAAGETMAVVMLLGNLYQIPTTIFDRGYAMTSFILLQIIYYIGSEEPRSAIFGIAAVLFIIELAMLLLAKYLVNYKNINIIQMLLGYVNGFIDTFKGGIKHGNKTPKP